MTEELILQYGYAGLFVVSFLAATLIPLGSEVFVTLMIMSGYNLLPVFLVATLGNTLGSVCNYYVGKYGGSFFLSRYIKPDSEKREKAERLYSRWGAPVLFFAWLPVVGDPLTVVAGIFNLNLYRFVLWVASGKAFRYIVVIAAAAPLS